MVLHRPVELAPFIRTYPRTVEQILVNGGRRTSRRDCDHLIGRDIARVLTLDAPASSVSLTARNIRRTRKVPRFRSAHMFLSRTKSTRQGAGRYRSEERRVGKECRS